MLVVLVARIAKHFEHFWIREGAAAVLGRAGVLASENCWNRLILSKGPQGFDRDLVAPIVSEIVDVEKPIASRDEIAEAVVSFFEQFAAIIPIVILWNAVAVTADHEHMKVGVLPSHCCLDHRVKAGE